MSLDDSFEFVVRRRVAGADKRKERHRPRRRGRVLLRSRSKLDFSAIGLSGRKHGFAEAGSCCRGRLFFGFEEGSQCLGDMFQAVG